MNFIQVFFMKQSLVFLIKQAIWKKKCSFNSKFGHKKFVHGKNDFVHGQFFCARILGLDMKQVIAKTIIS
jgi:hypothetical protein